MGEISEVVFGNCKRCKARFQFKSRNQLFCTIECKELYKEENKVSRIETKFYPCKSCGTEFKKETLADRSKTYCDVCREKRKYRKQKGTLKVCIDCNEDFIVTGGNHKRCTKCRDIKEPCRNKQTRVKRNFEKYINPKQAIKPHMEVYQARMTLGWTITELAEEVGISKQSMKKHERSEKINQSSKDKISSFFGVRYYKIKNKGLFNL
jgi:ribosome-binding protein aMBF1 (putative translation factor)